MCAHGHLGLHMAMEYTIGGRQFPDPHDRQAWNNEPLWRTRGSGVCYEAFRKALGCGHKCMSDW